MTKILIVEDDQMVANIYRNKFSVEGFQVEIAMDGQQGLEFVRSFQPDVVLLDLMLPKVSGVEFMRKVRADAQSQKLPIIVFSNTYLTNQVQEAWKAGATKCLSKANCSPQQLISVIRSTLATNGEPKTPAASDHAPEPAMAKSPAPAGRPAASTTKSGQKPGAVAHTGDEQFQGELRNSFLKTVPLALTALRASLQALVKTTDEATQVRVLNEMYRRVHSLTSNAGITGIATFAQMSDALEALLKELHDKPKNTNPSTLRTVASAVDFLGVLFERRSGPQPPADWLSNILVVDDEAISRRAVTYALEKAKLKSVAVDNPREAYNQLLMKKFDLVFLDVDMPGMNGFELCSKLRTLPIQKSTPVVFVTGLNDLESRANSMVSGGTDFIAKPFLFVELAVKALVHLLRSRLEPAR